MCVSVWVKTRKPVYELAPFVGRYLFTLTFGQSHLATPLTPNKHFEATDLKLGMCTQLDSGSNMGTPFLPFVSS